MTADPVTDALLKVIFQELVLPLLVIGALLLAAGFVILLVKRAVRRAFRSPPSFRTGSARTSGLVVPPQTRWQCARCGAFVSSGVRDYCLGRPGRFHGQIFCMRHQYLRRR